jgi:WD40 repeat protein
MSRIPLAVPLGAFAVLISVSPARGQQFSDWSAPVNLGPIVNSAEGDFFSTLSKDGLSQYFTSSRAHPDRQGGWDIYVSQRNSVSEPWGPPQNLGPAINTTFDEGAPSLSIDGHRMYFSSNRPEGFGGNDIYVSRRHDKRDDFGWEFPDNIGSGVNTDANEASPAIFNDDTTDLVTLYFDSNRAGGPSPVTNDNGNNGNDLYVATLGPDETFGPAELIAELSTPSFDRQPVIRRDGLEIFFASNRPGGVGMALDLWTSVRATTSDPWQTPVNLGPVVNSAANDAGPALSFKGTELYFQSAPPPGSGTAFDLYVTTRTKRKGHGPK